jgi:hypothetical protein
MPFSIATGPQIFRGRRMPRARTSNPQIATDKAQFKPNLEKRHAGKKAAQRQRPGVAGEAWCILAPSGFSIDPHGKEIE